MKKRPTNQPTAELTSFAKGFPPYLGWWLTRRTDTPWVEPVRRWFNGEHWSVPVNLGTDDATAEDAKSFQTLVPARNLEWSGLVHRPPLAFYHYPLVKSPRLVTHDKVAHAAAARVTHNGKDETANWVWKPVVPKLKRRETRATV